MVQDSPNETVFHADAEHDSLRMVVMLALLIALIGFFFLVQFAFRSMTNESPLVFVCSITLVLALVLGWLLENGLKRVWHSGRKLTVDETGIRAVNKIAADMHLRWTANVTSLKWAFRMRAYPRSGRERRVQGSYYCIAVQLHQGGQQLVVFSFLPPKRAQALLASDSLKFVELDPGDVYKTSMRTRFVPPVARPDIPSKVIAGPNGRYWLAEKRRWQEGFELEPKDFEQFLQLVENKSNQ
ncbi:MAG: hypothetical protein KC419_21625 [Anaerolineales bacterium]|nr:hypothetical protein [Anaerolineales bacterium]